MRCGCIGYLSRDASSLAKLQTFIKNVFIDFVSGGLLANLLVLITKESSWQLVHADTREESNTYTAKQN